MSEPIWFQTLRGRAFDLLDPKPEMVDFREIADALARLNRYAGNSEKPVSVALHSLIAADAAQEEDRAHVLLHDAHEFVIGEIPTPTVWAINEINRAVFGGAGAFTYALDSLKMRIDAAVHLAAGLPPPTAERRARIRAADLVALVTERRDFLARAPKPWAPEIEAVAPLPRKYRLRAAPDVADELYGKFKTYLPALRRSPA